jgi:hypothetical protein
MPHLMLAEWSTCGLLLLRFTSGGLAQLGVVNGETLRSAWRPMLGHNLDMDCLWIFSESSPTGALCCA